MSHNMLHQMFVSELGEPSATLSDSLIKQSLNHAVHDVNTEMDIPEFNALDAPLSTTAPYGCLHSDDIKYMGRYLTRTAMVFARMAELLTAGPHIDEACRVAHDRAKLQTGLANLQNLTVLDISVQNLRKSRDLATQLSRDLLTLWQPDEPAQEPPGIQLAASPFADSRVSSIPITPSPAEEGDLLRVLKVHTLLPENGITEHQLNPSSPQNPDSGSEDIDIADDDEGRFQDIDMTALEQRGKGNYVCPQGFSCRKGGVDKNNQLVVFDRNSAFKQHCNKHRKPYRCDHPGCPNPPKKRRFARRDGLERHLKSVKHIAPSEEPT